LRTLDQSANPTPVVEPVAPSDDNAPGRMRHAQPNPVAMWSAMLTLYLVWGSTYLFIALAVDTIPPFVMATARFLIGGLILLLWVVLRQRSALRELTRRELRDSLIVGALLLGGGMGLVAWGELTAPSSIAALLIAMMPVWVALLGRIVLGERLPAVTAAGIALGFVGVVVLLWPGDLSLGDASPAAIGALILSPICWATGSLYAAHRARLPRNPNLATSMQMLMGSLTLAVMALGTGELVGFDPSAISTTSIVAFLYLTFVGSLIAFSAYVWLLRVAPLPLVATYAYVNPAVAVVLGALVLDETLTPRALLAGAIIVVAVAIIVSTRGRLSGRRVVRGDAVDDPGQGADEPAVARPRTADAET
jgi:drug/metabolite transporter (DMT)-like permease